VVLSVAIPSVVTPAISYHPVPHDTTCAPTTPGPLWLNLLLPKYHAMASPLFLLPLMGFICITLFP
jgi:hypothetical protein